MVQKFINLKQKILKLQQKCYVFKRPPVDDMKKTGLNRYVYDFSVTHKRMTENIYFGGNQIWRINTKLNMINVFLSKNDICFS